MVHTAGEPLQTQPLAPDSLARCHPRRWRAESSACILCSMDLPSVRIYRAQRPKPTPTIPRDPATPVPQRRWRWRPMVRHKIGEDGEIRFVPDAGHHHDISVSAIDRAIARATISSLKLHKSSMPPPPRQTSSISTSRRSCARSSAAASSAAPAPERPTDKSPLRSSVRGASGSQHLANRRCERGLMPMRRGKAGRVASLIRRINLRTQCRFQSFESLVQHPSPARRIVSHPVETFAARLVHGVAMHALRPAGRSPARTPPAQHDAGTSRSEPGRYRPGARSTNVHWRRAPRVGQFAADPDQFEMGFDQALGPAIDLGNSQWQGRFPGNESARFIVWRGEVVGKTRA